MHWIRQPYALGGYLGGIWMVVVMAFAGGHLHGNQWMLMGITCAALGLFLAATAPVLSIRQRAAGACAILLLSTAGVIALGRHSAPWGDGRHFTVGRYTGELPSDLPERVLLDPDVQVWIKSRIAMSGNYPEGVTIVPRDGEIHVTIDEDLTDYNYTAQQLASALGLVLEQWSDGAIRRTYTASATFEQEIDAYPPPRPVSPPAVAERDRPARPTAETPRKVGG